MGFINCIRDNLSVSNKCVKLGIMHCIKNNKLQVFFLYEQNYSVVFSNKRNNILLDKLLNISD